MSFRIEGNRINRFNLFITGDSTRWDLSGEQRQNDRVSSNDHSSEFVDHRGDSGSKELVNEMWEALHEVNIKLADKQADVNSPLYSAKSFEELGLDESLLKGIYAMKFIKPSKVQERALPLLLANPPTNFIGQSQSGTGKTAAFVLTMLQRVDSNKQQVQALCLAPTRELARQIYDVTIRMGQFTKCTVALASRESGPRSLVTVTSHIVIGTPGTLLELERRQLLDFTTIKVFILDEADIMLDRQGLGMQSLRIRKACPEDTQTIFFSATFTDQVIEFANRVAPNANQLTLKRDELSLQAIKQYYMLCNNFGHKFELLSTIYGLMTVSQSIVFVATRVTADQVQAHMEKEGHRTSILHGGQTVEERDRIIEDFRRGATKVLISTNVLARGIDILQVSLVINFDLPMTTERTLDPETYLHRIGRTGRFGRTGVAINFVHNDHTMNAIKNLEAFFGIRIPEIPTNTLEAIEAKLNENK